MSVHTLVVCINEKTSHRDRQAAARQQMDGWTEARVEEQIERQTNL